MASLPCIPVPARRPSNQSDAVTTGLKWAPETGPNSKIPVPVLAVLAGVYLLAVGVLAKIVAYLGGDTTFALKVRKEMYAFLEKHLK